MEILNVANCNDFWGVAEASHALSGTVNKWHVCIIFIAELKKFLIKNFSWIHNILRIEYFLYRFHIGDFCRTT
jgi:hypothetical protein